MNEDFSYAFEYTMLQLRRDNELERRECKSVIQVI